MGFFQQDAGTTFFYNEIEKVKKKDEVHRSNRDEG
jgi:hypothetical protein